MLAIGTPSFSPNFAQTPKALSSKKFWILTISLKHLNQR